MVGKIVGACAAVGLLTLGGCRERPDERLVPQESIEEQQGPPAGGGAGDAGIEPQGRRLPVPRPEIVPVRQVQPDDDDENRVRGKVRYVGPATVRIEDDAQRWYDLHLTPQTEVTLGGRGASALEFADGTLVDAEFRLDNGSKIATKVRVLTTP